MAQHLGGVQMLMACSRNAALLSAASAGVLLLSLLTIAIYQVKFHPLRRFPGPLLAKFSDFYPAYWAAKGEAHVQIWQAHQKYGSIVRYGPQKLVFNTTTAFHAIYGAKGLQKAKGYEQIGPAPGVYNTLSCIDKTLHKRKRKVVSQSFSEQAIRSFEPTILRNVDVLLKQIAHSRTDVTKKGWTDVVNMTDKCKRFTLDVMGELAFGDRFDLQTREENRFILQAVRATSKVCGVYSQFPELKSTAFERLMKSNSKSNWTQQKFGVFMKEVIQRRLVASRDISHDLFSFIIDAKDPETGEGFSLDEIWAESRLFMVAGSDTTASALTSTLFYLSRYPDCLSRLVQTIRQTFPSSKDIHSGKIAGCRYLRACIDESMRMSPHIGTALWREVTEGGIVIDGEYLPSGTEVGASLYSLHHNESAFPDSFVFRPERWLGEVAPGIAADEEDLKRMRACFHPFSFGSRKCVAQALAYTELSLAIAKLLWFFDLRRPTDGHLDTVGAGIEGQIGPRGRVMEFQIVEHLTSTGDGPWLAWKLRDGIDLDLELAGLAAIGPK